MAVTALSLPGAAVMTLAGGALFGLGWGLLLVSFASSLGATLAMLVSAALGPWAGRGIDRWGHFGDQGLHPNSVAPLLRAVLQSAGLPAELYSSHSLRRGFATWATRSGWDLKALMQYVGWSDGQSALRYVESTGVFPGQLSALQLIPAR